MTSYMLTQNVRLTATTQQWQQQQQPAGASGSGAAAVGAAVRPLTVPLLDAALACCEMPLLPWLKSLLAQRPSDSSKAAWMQLLLESLLSVPAFRAAVVSDARALPGGADRAAATRQAAAAAAAADSGAARDAAALSTSVLVLISRVAHRLQREGLDTSGAVQEVAEVRQSNSRVLAWGGRGRGVTSAGILCPVLCG